MHRRQAEAAETEARRATEARAKAQKEQEAQEERLRPLQVAKSRYEREVAELGEVVRELTAELQHLQVQDEEESKNEEQQSWWPVSLIHGKANDTEEQKQLQADERLNRLQSSRIKRIKLEQNEAKLQRQRDVLSKVNGKIAAEKDYVESEMKKAEETRKKEEHEAKKAHRMNLEDERQRMAKAQEERAKRERAERKVLEAWKTFQGRAAQERARMVAAGERRQDHWVEQTSRKTCRHENFWEVFKSWQTCDRCWVERSAFRCTGCKMVECSHCFRGVDKRA